MLRLNGLVGRFLQSDEKAELQFADFLHLPLTGNARVITLSNPAAVAPTYQALIRQRTQLAEVAPLLEHSFRDSLAPEAFERSRLFTECQFKARSGLILKLILGLDRILNRTSGSPTSV